MPFVTVHKGGQVFRDEVADNTNLVVRAGIRKFPYPNFKYKCGMGKCATCTSRIISGGEHLPAPNWKEKKLLGDYGSTAVTGSLASSGSATTSS